VTLAEKKLLEEVLERSLGVARRKPIPKATATKKAAPKKTVAPRKTIPIKKTDFDLPF
jgi:hypothetical protein